MQLGGNQIYLISYNLALDRAGNKYTPLKFWQTRKSLEIELNTDDHVKTVSGKLLLVSLKLINTRTTKTQLCVSKNKCFTCNLVVCVIIFNCFLIYSVITTTPKQPFTIFYGCNTLL